MAPKRRIAGSPEPATSPLRAPVPPPPLSDSPEEIKVNNYNAAELKVACDDALRRYIARPDTSFRTVNRHTDIKLALGWSSVIIAGLTAAYGYKVEFEKSKPAVWVGVILYVVLSSLYSLYAYFIEGDTIFEGKRKTYAKRVESERIRVDAKSNPPKYSSILSGKATTASAPSYQMSMSYVRLTNSGKTVIHKGKERAEASYATFFDSEGRMDVPKFEAWVAAVMARVMGIRTDNTT
ncbi:hypothetical protein M408DRAFT_75422 [Serendipita vermifera MAFF 305830]|uniref:Signal peptidase complex subunit 2 n=1 Tax=Serendipita vermifera MAFF 305830 TaxID=933852 RepID=A0A0C2X699_SERVB|nr:hypothetical protein M408DRAFT_75422 [Serendipita vermifera MAFF 305830]